MPLARDGDEVLAIEALLGNLRRSTALALHQTGWRHGGGWALTAFIAARSGSAAIISLLSEYLPFTCTVYC
ncbi:MAG TPA: hypothetical protein V6C88_12465 [Chroococcidiopsis sp.]